MQVDASKIVDPLKPCPKLVLRLLFLEYFVEKIIKFTYGT